MEESVGMLKGKGAVSLRAPALQARVSASTLAVVGLAHADVHGVGVSQPTAVQAVGLPPRGW